MKKLIWIIVLILAAGGGWYLWRQHQAAAPAGAAEGGAGGGGRGGGQMGPVPVVIAEAQQEDVPIYLEGLGTVQAFNSVTVRSRIDGQLEKVAFTEGQEVKAGALLAVIDARPFQAQVAQAEAKRKQDDAQIGNARVILERNTDLLKKGVLDKQTFDTSRFQVEQLGGTLAADDAAIENARIQLSYTQITAPIDGRVGVRRVDAGNIVHASDPNGLVVLTQLHPISVLFTLPEKNLQTVLEHSKDQEPLAVQAFDRGNTKPLGDGKLAVIDNEIDPATATVRLKATFPNEDQRLWPGQFVNARLLLTTRKGGITIPASAVQRGPNGSYIYVITQDQTAEMRPVTVVQTQSDKSLIDQGVEKGDRVVVDGQYKLQPGAHVEITQPGAKPGKPGGPGGRPGGGQRPAGKPGGGDADKKNAAQNEAAPAVDGKEHPLGTPTRFRANKPAAQ